MAFLPTSEKEKEEEKKAGGQSSENVLSSSSGSVGGGAGTAAPSASSSSAGASGGTGFVNLQSYLDKNKQGAERMATGLAGKVQGQADTARGAVDTAKTQFQQRAEQGRVTGADDIAKKIKAGQAANVDQERYKRASSGVYGGPQGLDDSAAASAVGKARQSRDLTRTSEGRHELLRDVYNRPTYSKGMSRLDQALIAADPTSRGKFQEVRQQNQGLSDYLDKARGFAAERAGQYQQEAEQAQTALRGAVDERTTAFQKDLERRLAEQNRQRSQAYDQTAARLSPGGNKFAGLAGQGSRWGNAMSQLEDLGVSQQDISQALKDSGYRYSNMESIPGQLGGLLGGVNWSTDPGMQHQAQLNMPGIDAAAYLSQSPELNIAQVAQDRDRAELAALQGLGGRDVGLNLSGGGAVADPYSFRRDDFLNAVREAGGRMEDYYRTWDKNIPGEVLAGGLSGGGLNLPTPAEIQAQQAAAPPPVFASPDENFVAPNVMINSASY